MKIEVSRPIRERLGTTSRAGALSEPPIASPHPLGNKKTDSGLEGPGTGIGLRRSRDWTAFQVTRIRRTMPQLSLSLPGQKSKFLMG